MESTPRPGYYPDPSVPGYIRYWDGSKWVPGTSKPMPKKAGGGADADLVVESGAVPPPPRAAGAASSAGESSAVGSVGSSQGDLAGSGMSRTVTEAPAPPAQSQAHTSSLSSPSPSPKAPAFASPRPLSEVSFDDAKPSAATFPGRSSAPEFPGSAPEFPAAASEPKAPSFTSPKLLSDTSFDDMLPADPPRPAPPSMPGFGAGVGFGDQPPTSPVGPVASASGMGISITGVPGMHAPPKQTPAQLSAGNQSLRIRLLRPDGKPFDGPEITTGPKQADGSQNASRTDFDTARGPKKQAPKVVVKTGPLERAGHTLAVLLISAVGIVPLGYLMMQSVHDRENKLAETISAPTKMNVLDTTSEAYLGGMVAVLLVVTVLYWTRLRRRRAR